MGNKRILASGIPFFIIVLLVVTSVLPIFGCGRSQNNKLPLVIDDWFIVLPGDLNHPLNPLFSEIIPSSQDVADFYAELKVVEGGERPQTDVLTRFEETWPQERIPGQGGEEHQRVLTVKHYKDVKQIGEVSIALRVEVYAHEAGAIERYQNVERLLDIKSDTSVFRIMHLQGGTSGSITKDLEPNPDEAWRYTYETDRYLYDGPSEKDWEREGTVFRVGLFVGWYQITEYDPPNGWPNFWSGMYELSFHLQIMLDWMVETTIAKLQLL